MRIIGTRQTGLLGGVALGAALGGCNSFDDAPGPNSNQPRLVIPVDERPARASAIAPRPVTGGTLSVTANGSYAIASDPERDLVSIVDLATLSVRTITLEAGDEPARVIEDGTQRIHVALRGGGAIVSIDPATASVVDRRAVCRAPRGIAYEAATTQLHVACAEGKLVSLPAGGGAPTRSLTLEPDLRDVIVRGSELWVTRFKSAEVLRVSGAGALQQRVVIPPGRGTLIQPLPEDEAFGAQKTADVAVQAHVAWRAVPTSSGGAIVVHQQAVADEIDIPPPSSQGSAYGGGGFGCGGIVRTALTHVGTDGATVSAAMNGAPLPVDVAVSPDQQWLAVAHAGPADVGAPRPFLEFPQADDAPSTGPVFDGGGFGSSLTLTSMSNLKANPEGCTFGEGSVPIDQPVTAVAFAPNGSLLAQTREPPQLLIVPASDVPFGAPFGVALAGDSRLDTGHELFHRDSGGGIACASCHPEGGEDGQTWRFTDVGERRTQALHVGLRDTAPFHWNGDLENVAELMTEVFVARMGGVRQSDPRLDSLSQWLFSIEPPPAIRPAEDAAAARGKQLFDSASVGCASCHSGSKLTNNESAAIDSVAAGRLQVPSLVAVGYRAPFMHTGCAATLTARFDPACGGDAHGNTQSLSPEQIGDLVAYLESL